MLGLTTVAPARTGKVNFILLVEGGGYLEVNSGRQPRDSISKAC